MNKLRRHFQRRSLRGRRLQRLLGNFAIVTGFVFGLTSFAWQVFDHWPEPRLVVEFAPFKSFVARIGTTMSGQVYCVDPPTQQIELALINPTATPITIYRSRLVWALLENGRYVDDVLNFGFNSVLGRIDAGQSRHSVAYLSVRLKERLGASYQYAVALKLWTTAGPLTFEYGLRRAYLSSGELHSAADVPTGTSDAPTVFMKERPTTGQEVRDQALRLTGFRSCVLPGGPNGGGGGHRWTDLSGLRSGSPVIPSSYWDDTLGGTPELVGTD